MALVILKGEAEARQMFYRITSFGQQEVPASRFLVFGKDRGPLPAVTLVRAIRFAVI